MLLIEKIGMNILKLIKQRRSIRKFKPEEISEELIKEILEAGRWAPSGLNNQPWRFMVLAGAKKDALAEYTKYSHIVKGCNKAVLVFMDKDILYNFEKDLMAVGACVQNMLLYIHSRGLGACWLGEILNKRDEINKFLKLSENLILEAVIALGKSSVSSQKSPRKNLEDLIIKDEA